MNANNKIVIYIHGQDGSIEEANHYKALFDNCDVVGLDYKSQYPWEAKEEISTLFDNACNGYDSVIVIANSIGAYFTMVALSNKKIDNAFFISPIVDMQRLIEDLMKWSNVSEDELCRNGEIETISGEVLSWDYLSYVRQNPINWKTPTHILYGEKDNLIPIDTVSDFANKTGATLTVMKNGEHWFHTCEQMNFLDNWIRNNE